ncbi:hypothetical protein HPP92_002870 [Vanilla planifolia]|uniref:Pentatricopeptide repeat-containing protein n=1 Tax=Vanilla planifolia TaxID=51239 RepID=A0A835RYY2_VANPL|nr:hypothetical protein HPP92_002870 [Vanilla planifolia]
MSTILCDILKRIKQSRSLKSLKQTHARIIICGLSWDNHLAVKLVTCCSQTLYQVCYARTIFDWLFRSANVYLWTAMITCYSHQQSEVSKEAITIYRMMLKEGSCPNNFTISAVLKACSFLKATCEGRQIHAHSIKLGFVSSIYVQTTLIHMYTKFGWVQEACYLFDNMTEKNVVTYNAIIACHVSAGNIEAARGTFDQMSQRDAISWNTILYSYAYNGDVVAALQLFEQMPVKETNSWNALIVGYSHRGEWDHCLKLLTAMQLNFATPNCVTMAMLMSCCGQLGALIVGRQLHGFLHKFCSPVNSYVFNSVVDMYAKCGSIHESYSVFFDMPEKDIVSYNTIINGLANHGHGKEALILFWESLKRKIQPDVLTFLGILTACSQSRLLDLSPRYFECMRSFSIEPSTDHYACIVDLFGRVGLVEKAYEIVKSMLSEPHAGIWGALLNACSIYCHVEIGRIAAQELFKLEPENPGNYIILSNIYARAHLWGGVKEVRCLMRGKGVAKNAGCSWIELNNQVYEFVSGDVDNPLSEEIFALLRQPSLHLALLN